MGVACISTRTFFCHQRHILIPAIQRIWEQQQLFSVAMLQLEKQQRDIVLGGHGRADSPGHSAKYAHT